MSSDWGDDENRKEETEILFINDDNSKSSSEEPPMHEWSSLVDTNKYYENPKKSLYAEGLYHPGSGEICAKFLRMSDSSVLRHAYYNYPAVLDPGIKIALLDPEPIRPPYTDDGYEIYMALCKEHNVSPTRIFYTNLLSPEINLSYYCPSSANFRMMAIALQRNKYVRRLNLTDNYIDVDACYHLGKMIQTNSTLEELILDGCRIREVGLRNLCEKIHNNMSITTLSLSRNDLNDEGGVLFAELIGSGANFRKVNLKNNHLAEKTALALHEALPINNILTHLDISCNSFVSIGPTVKFLKSLAETSNKLVELDLSYMGFDSTNVAEAIASVTLIKSLKILNIRNNRFNDECAPILMSKLKTSNLRSYDLSNNFFTPTGASKILLSLTQVKVKVQKLFLDNICVNKTFMDILRRIKKMKSRKNFVVTFDRVLHNWEAIGDDPRRLILRRGDFMGKMKKKAPKDVPMFLLSLSHAADFIRPKELIVMMKDQKIPTNDDWVEGLTKAFPGPVIDKKPTVDSLKMREFMKRLWPDLKLPPDWTPPVMIRVDVKRKAPKK